MREDYELPETVPQHLAQIEDRLDGIDKDIDLLQAVASAPALEAMDSKGPASLYKAMAKAQSKLTNAEQDAENKHWNTKYATLASVMKAIRGPLSKNGLSIMQLPGRTKDDGVELLTLTTILAHESGESIENYFEMYPPKNDPQGIGSAMTYMRRYAAMAICGIAGAADDDAEATVPQAATISHEQVDELLAYADGLFGSDADAILQRMCDKVFQVDAVAKIPEAGFQAAMNSLNNKKKRDQGNPPKAKAPDVEKPEADTKKPQQDSTKTKPSMGGGK